jgi:hypothetical protein
MFMLQNVEAVRQSKQVINQQLILGCEVLELEADWSSTNTSTLWENELPLSSGLRSYYPETSLWADGTFDTAIDCLSMT